MKTTLPICSRAPFEAAPLVRSSLSVASAFTVMLLSAAVQTQALAQETAAAPSKHSLWLEPRVSVGVTLSSNGQLSATHPQSEQLIEVSPGVRLVANGPRAKGFLDYSLSGLYHAQGLG